MTRRFQVLIRTAAATGFPEFTESKLQELSQPFLATYSLEALLHVESVSAAISDISVDSIPGGIECCLAYSRQRLEEIESNSKGSVPEELSDASKDDHSDEWQVTSTAGPAWGALVSGYPASDPLIRVGKVLEFKLGLEISGEWSRKHKREIVEFGGRTLMKRNEFENQLRYSVRYAESQFVDKFRAREIPGLNRRYQFEAYSGIYGYSSTPYTGGSAGLALSILCMAALDGLRVRNRQRRIHPGTAFTGQIDLSGNVLSVDDTEISVKTRAVFRSSCTRFVVPEGNYDTARKTLDELNNEHSNRPLELISATNVSDIYESDLISSEKAVSVPSLAISRARRKRKTLLATVSSAVAIVALAAVAMFSAVFFTKNLNSARFDGQRIELVNRFNRVYKEVELPYRVNIKGDNNYMDTSGKSHRLVIEDITGDGNRELLFIGVGVNSADTDHFGTIHVHLFDKDGNEKSHIVAFDSIEVTLGEDRGVVRDVSYNKDAVVDLDGDGFKEVVLYFVQRLWASSGVTVYSLKNKTTQTFMHHGNIQNLIVTDYDGDGFQDIVLTAECNYVWNSVLIVLDPEHVKGSSPLSEEIPRFVGFDDNVAKYVIFMPKSVVFKAQHGVVENYAERPNIETLFVNDNERVEIGVCEWQMEKTCAVLLYTFGPDWSCIKVFPTNPYNQEYKRLVQKGENELQGIEYKDYLESLKSKFRYLDGDTLTSRPVINSGYKAVVNESS